MSLNSETNEIKDLDLDNLKMHADSSKIKLPSYISQRHINFSQNLLSQRDKLNITIEDSLADKSNEYAKLPVLSPPNFSKNLLNFSKTPKRERKTRNMPMNMMANQIQVVRTTNTSKRGDLSLTLTPSNIAFASSKAKHYKM